jgi:hypothetical protein
MTNGGNNAQRSLLYGERIRFDTPMVMASLICRGYPVPDYGQIADHCAVSIIIILRI